MNLMKYYVDAAGSYLGGWDASPPAGAIEVPTAPEDARQVWDGQAWSPLPSPDIITAIKAEARRRIIAIMNEDKQRNTLAAGLEATMTYGADPADWPPELQQRQAEAMAAWTEIERLRTRSDEIELMDPLPADVTEDGLWEAA